MDSQSKPNNAHLHSDSTPQQADADQAAINAEMHPLSLPDGGSLSLFSRGHGPPMIFVPMIAELNFVYMRQVETLSAHFRTILYEPRLSDSRRISIRDRAYDIECIIEALNLGSAHIVAWSDAGSPAYHLAKTRPDLCESLCFLGLADRYRFPFPLQLLMLLYWRFPIEHVVPNALLARILSYYLGGDQVASSDVAKRARAIPRLARFFKNSVLANLMEHTPAAGEVRAPALVVCGDRDRLVTTQQAQRMAKLLANGGEAKIVPGGEHFLGWVDPVAVDEAMLAFYDALPAASRAKT